MDGRTDELSGGRWTVTYHNSSSLSTLYSGTRKLKSIEYCLYKLMNRMHLFPDTYIDVLPSISGLLRSVFDNGFVVDIYPCLKHRSILPQEYDELRAFRVHGVFRYGKN